MRGRGDVPICRPFRVGKDLARVCLRQGGRGGVMGWLAGGGKGSCIQDTGREPQVTGCGGGLIDSAPCDRATVWRYSEGGFMRGLCAGQTKDVLSGVPERAWGAV